jgi:hypothetical protein
MAEPFKRDFEQEPKSPSFSVPDHKLIRLIGKGSYGEVWLAKTTVGAWRAVKIVFEHTFRHRKPFEREFNGVQKFEPLSRLHEGLVDILQIGRNEERGYFYCVMELADDVRTGRKIDPDNYTPHTLCAARDQRLPLDECRRIGATIASALDLLHSRGLIHRDVKPSNIIFVDGVPKLADIGLVAEMSEARSYVGTEGFIPPEGPGTVRADIYSLGKVLYEISTGKDRHDYPELPPPLDDPEQETEFMELNKIILKACRSDPARRYESAGALVGDLTGLPHGKIGGRGRRLGLAAISVFVILVAVAIAAACHKPGPKAQATLQPFHPDGLVAWWRAEQNLNDAGGRFPGEAPFGIAYGRGPIGSAFSFDGMEKRVNVPDRPEFRMTNGFTISAWIYPRSFAGTICCRGDDRQWLDTWFLALGLGNTDLFFLVCDQANNGFSIQAPVKLHQWQHIVASWDRASATFRCYVDGELAAAGTNHLVPIMDLDPKLAPGISIGNQGGVTHSTGFNGLIDEVTIYSRALSPDEVRETFHADAVRRNPASFHTAAPVPAGVVAWWPGDGFPRNYVVTSDPQGNAFSYSSREHPDGPYALNYFPGKVGGAFDFRTPGARVRNTDREKFALTNSLTMEAWVLTRSGSGIVFQRGDSRAGPKPYTLRAEVGQIVFEIGSLTNATAIAAPITSNQWVHIAATLDGATGDLILYTNGTAAVRTRTSVRPFGQLDPALDPFISIGNGCDLQQDHFFDGAVDELTLYNRALAPDEIAAIYHADLFGKISVKYPRPEPPLEKPAKAPRMAAAIPAGLIAWWRGENTAEDTIGGHMGEPTPGISYIPGVVEHCFHFDGHDSVRITNKKDLDPGRELTIEFWMRANRSNPMNRDAQGLVTSDFYSVEVSGGMDGGTGINFVISTNSGRSWSRVSEPNHGGAIITSMAFHHIAAVYDGTNARLYIDGSAWGKPVFCPGTISPMLPGSFVAIGSSDGRTACPAVIDNQYFKGAIDEVSIYNRALSAEEIESIFQAGDSGKRFDAKKP